MDQPDYDKMLNSITQLIKKFQKHNTKKLKTKSSVTGEEIDVKEGLSPFLKNQTKDLN